MKIIHQIFLDIGLKPLEERRDYLENIEVNKRINPEWEHKLWTDDSLNEFVSTHYPENLIFWNNFPYPMYKIDYARYMLLHHYGGIYIDLDERCIKPLEEFKFFYGKWYDTKTDKWITNNNIMMIEDKTLCKELIDYVNSQIIERKKSIPPTWKCRLFQHSVSQVCFKRFCKLKNLVSDADYLDYFKTESTETCSWLYSIKNKI